MTNPGGNPDRSQTRVVVAMSGGVDSSVAAALLVEQGYDVIGMMLRLWSEPGRESFNRCCTPDQMADARCVAEHLGIPFYAVDVKDYFRKTIVQFFIDEYAAGRTPNPCIECNRHIRFEFLLDHALALEADYLATGHYARIKQSETGFELLQGLDAHKDQSYVLHILNQPTLSQVLFPVGAYTKQEVRALAAHFGLVSAKTGDSQDLCFLGQDDYQAFLERNAPEIGRIGPIITTHGEQIGLHCGLPFYTIGQRKGLGVSAATPLFVVAKDMARNALIVGTREESGSLSLHAEHVNWISGSVPTQPFRAQVKVRYKSIAHPATVTAQANDSAFVQFDDPVTGIAPGQGAVFYDGNRCLGGGLIASGKMASSDLAAAATQESRQP